MMEKEPMAVSIRRAFRVTSRVVAIREKLCTEENFSVHSRAEVRVESTGTHFKVTSRLFETDDIWQLGITILGAFMKAPIQIGHYCCY